MTTGEEPEEEWGRIHEYDYVATQNLEDQDKKRYTFFAIAAMGKLGAQNVAEELLRSLLNGKRFSYAVADIYREDKKDETGSNLYDVDFEVFFRGVHYQD